MDQGSMDPHFGLGPWTTFMDQVHGPPVMDRVHGQFFLIMRNEQKQTNNSAKIRLKNNNNNEQCLIGQ